MFGVVIIAILVMGYFLVLNNKAKNKGTALLEKAITAVLSTIVFSLYLAFMRYTPVEEQQAGVGYTSLEGLLIIYTMFSLPIFLICSSNPRWKTPPSEGGFVGLTLFQKWQGLCFLYLILK